MKVICLRWDRINFCQLKGIRSENLNGNDQVLGAPLKDEEHELPALQHFPERQ